MKPTDDYKLKLCISLTWTEIILINLSYLKVHSFWKDMWLFCDNLVTIFKVNQPAYITVIVTKYESWKLWWYIRIQSNEYINNHTENDQKVKLNGSLSSRTSFLDSYDSRNIVTYLPNSHFANISGKTGR